MNINIIIILGENQNNDYADLTTLERLNKCIDLYLKFSGQCIIICSGGDTAKIGKSEADIMKDKLVCMGIPENIIVKENNSVNTKDNVLMCRFILNSFENYKNKTILNIITSDFHIKRTRMLFNKYFSGFKMKFIEAKSTMPAEYKILRH